MTANPKIVLPSDSPEQELSVPHDFTVLIVEDDDDACRNMEDILSLDGYKVKSVSHCLPAIEAVKKERFGAVIVDWRLPDQNADQLIPIIIRHQSETPVVVVTGIRDFDTAIEALRSGAYDFLLKPINADVLRSVLNRIVERQKHLSAIKTAQDKLLINERLAAIGQMVTGLAHESRNAFQRSHACLEELLLDLKDMPESIELVRKVQKALDELNQMLEEVRDYSAPIILKRGNCCLESIFKETWQQVLDAAQSRKGTVFVIEKDDSFPDQCFLDSARIQQVIRNLLENALFACSDPGEVKVRLEICDRPNPNRLTPGIRIKVSDDGAGVPVPNRETVFNPFYTTKVKGTGLGLSVSRRYVEAHGGRIFFDDSDGHSTFVVEMPLTQK